MIISESYKIEELKDSIIKKHFKTIIVPMTRKTSTFNLIEEIAKVTDQARPKKPNPIIQKFHTFFFNHKFRNLKSLMLYYVLIDESLMRLIAKLNLSLLYIRNCPTVFRFVSRNYLDSGPALLNFNGSYNFNSLKRLCVTFETILLSITAPVQLEELIIHCTKSSSKMNQIFTSSHFNFRATHCTSLRMV